MSRLRDKAVRIVNDFFEIDGPFTEARPEGIVVSNYPKALARLLKESDEELQREVIDVLLTFAMDGTYTLSRPSAYVCSDLAMRGFATTFIPHVSMLREWIERRAEMGWWTTDASYEAPPPEARNANYLIGVLWCCDERTASELTEMLLRKTSSPKFRTPLTRWKLLPQILPQILK